MLADKFSRRIGITVYAVVFILGGTLQTAAPNKEMMMAGRFIAGFSIGGMCLLVPLYQSEISLPRFRGRLTTLQQFFLGWGAFLAGWIAYGCTRNQYGKPMQWRLPVSWGSIPVMNRC
jgi:MFS family permease